MRKFRSALGAVAVGIALAGIAVPLAAGGSAAATISPPRTIVLTNASDGSTVIAFRGGLVVVDLTGGPLRWSEAQVAPSPTGSVPSLVRVSGSVSSTGSSRTIFKVVAYGTAQLDALGTPVCGRVPACPMFVLLWHAQVVVPVKDPPPPVA